MDHLVKARPASVCAGHYSRWSGQSDSRIRHPIDDQGVEHRARRFRSGPGARLRRHDGRHPVRRRGRRLAGTQVALIASAFLFGAAILAIAAAHGVGEVGLYRFLAGLGLGGALPAAALIAELWHGHEEGGEVGANPRQELRGVERLRRPARRRGRTCVAHCAVRCRPRSHDDGALDRILLSVAGPRLLRVGSHLTGKGFDVQTASFGLALFNFAEPERERTGFTIWVSARAGPRFRT